MKTLFLFQTFSFEQSTIYLDLIRAVRDAGHEVTVIAGTSDRDMPETSCAATVIPTTSWPEWPDGP